ncbi:hypothetical protein POVWA2_038020 [Plasmodium ovale wallikeri]|uniref:Uncharacterized protein n=1 Tax=Plasmodium ovale wallikeri TaxID=864142 RepID=A0A1A8Z6S2_PLAOA|nr:hypothetical protein POVWA1_039060 [Plasmodium ovale wallikeri]SBT39564.1 hypothetical protein POVWA2_038020 [Plasmodium ovale wallikeri]
MLPHGLLQSIVHCIAHCIAHCITHCISHVYARRFNEVHYRTTCKRKKKLEFDLPALPSIASDDAFSPIYT